MASNWPLTATDMRAALQIGPTDEDTTELMVFMAAACEAIDLETGRNLEPTRHEIGGKVPAIFILAGRETAKLWWQQTKNGPRNRPNTGETVGPPMGADLPSKVKGWLAKYPPRLYRDDPAFTSVTLTYPDGSAIALSRSGNIVTASATAGTNPSSLNRVPLPAGFAPTGNVYGYMFRSAGHGLTPGNWYVSLVELDDLGQSLGIAVDKFSAGPWLPFTVQWLADPA